MSKQAKKGCVPVLRFPEFREEWENKKFGEMCKFVRGPFGGALKKDIFVKDGYAVYEQSHAIYQNFDSFRYFITEEKYNELKRFSVKPNDIIMSCSGTMGKFAVIPNELKKGVINQALLKLTVNNGYNLDFVKFTLELPINQEKLLSQSAGGAIKNVVGVGDMKEIEMSIPSFNEQEKIAACLSSLDELITAQAKKVEAIKTHKKGLMQQLFPAEGEAVPKLRFPEFREAGEWEEVQLGQCLIKHPEYGINAAAVPFSENLPTYLRITDISEDGYFIENSKVSVNKKVTIENYLNEGDIVLARTGASVGKSYKYRVKDGKLVFAGFLIRVKPNEKKLNSELLFQFLATEQYWRWVKLTSARSGQPGINGNEYSLLPIPLPPFLEEQQKIAACLSSLDELITAQAQKINALKTHKKGLMQQLFPAVDEVNA